MSGEPQSIQEVSRKQQQASAEASQWTRTSVRLWMLGRLGLEALDMEVIRLRFSGKSREGGSVGVQHQGMHSKCSHHLDF